MTNMKAVLTSTNITEIEGGVALAEKLIGKSRKEINIAVINEASAVEFGDHRWAISALSDLAENFGGSIEIVHLLALSPEQIRARIDVADMFFVLGGNTEWLKSVFDKTGFSKILPDILKDKLYVGSSAGSMILGHRPSYKIQAAAYGESECFGVESYLDLVDFSILPHFHAEYLNNRGSDWALAESKSVGYPVYAISDKAAVVVDGEKNYLMGNDYMKLVAGEAVECSA